MNVSILVTSHGGGYWENPQKTTNTTIISLRKYFTPRMVRNPPPRILENLLENEFFLSPRDVRIKRQHFSRVILF